MDDFPTLSGRPWTPLDDAILLTGIKAGKNTQQLSIELHRTTMAVRQRRIRLGIHQKRPPQPQPDPAMHRPPAPPSPRAAALTPIASSRSCMWPIGEPRSSGFRYCDAPSVDSRSYCHEHCMRAYERYAAVNQESMQP
ncbi:GcrA family cell cycle regulator [Granulibacter bethesdensis]|uniref:GcrA family cell cycle regulator n=1 Tax=Granulibacter bethesdensis TaxID=364410 RepID=UPI000932622F